MASVVHSIHVSEPYFGLIAGKRKTVELRINDEKRQKIRKGDGLLMICKETPRKLVVANVASIERFSTFEEALNTVGTSAAMPDVASIGDAVMMYKKIPGYASKESDLGVVAIYLTDVFDCVPLLDIPLSTVFT